jgi:hypothetical protein
MSQAPTVDPPERMLPDIVKPADIIGMLFAVHPADIIPLATETIRPPAFLSPPARNGPVYLQNLSLLI